MQKQFFKPALFIIIIALGIFFVLSRKSEENIATKEVPEITAIKTTTNLKEQIVLYKQLIERVGPEQAQIDLYLSGLPFTGETHLLNHTVGDYLYEKHGPAGLPKCRDFFLSSCYHGFILHAIAEGGMEKVEESFAECIKYGHTVSSQCSHAIGHGFLTNVGYKNMLQALETCDVAERTMAGFPAFNCYDGVFMENIWAVHDGKPSPLRWVKEQDLVYPCNDKRIAEKYLLGCWSNQPSLVFQLTRGDIKKTGEVCLDIENTEHERMCFDGLARQIHPITQGKTSSVFELCGMMPARNASGIAAAGGPDKSWQNFCVNVNAGSSYAVGDRTSPFEICGATDEPNKPDCYGRVFSMMRAYRKQREDLKNLCRKITDASWRDQCEESLIRN